MVSTLSSHLVRECSEVVRCEEIFRGYFYEGNVRGNCVGKMSGGVSLGGFSEECTGEGRITSLYAQRLWLGKLMLKAALQGGSKKVSCCTVSTAYFFWSTLYIQRAVATAQWVRSCSAAFTHRHRQTDKQRLTGYTISSANWAKTYTCFNQH